MNGKNGVKRSIVFFLVPDFSMIAFATAIEPLRLANRMLGHESYKWRLSSLDGKPVTASNGVTCAVTASLDDERRMMMGPDKPSMIFVCSGVNVEKFHNKSVFAFLREEYNRGVSVGGLCTGAHILAAAGLLSGKRCAIHWENLPGFAEAYPKANVFADLFEIDSNIYTCAGGTAALDMMVKLIGDDHDENLVNRVCEQALTDRVRNPQDRQRLPLRARLGVQNSKVLTIIELMEANLSEPLSLRSGLIAPDTCSSSPHFRLWKLQWPAASFRHHISPSATVKSMAAHHSRSGWIARRRWQHEMKFLPRPLTAT